MYGARILPFYEKTVIKTLKNGPKTRKELVEEICPKMMSKKKLQKTLNELEDEGRIICHPRRFDKSHKWTSVYALPKYRHLLELDYGRVVRVVKYLRLRLCRNPDVEEVAVKIEEDPENVRKTLFKHASELKWSPPTKKEKEETRKLQNRAREVAAVVKYRKEDDYGLEEKISKSDISREVLESAQFLLEHQYNSIKEKDMPVFSVLMGPGFPLPSKPHKRSKKEALKTIKSTLS